MLTVPLISNSVSIQRLQQMRQSLKEDISGLPELHDNCLRSAIQSFVCLRRIKHAGLIGRFYWHRNREDVIAKDYEIIPEQGYDPHENSYLRMMKKDPSLAGGLDFAQIGMAIGMELECFSTFLASSVKDEINGAYRLKQTTGDKHLRISAQPYELMSLTITGNDDTYPMIEMTPVEPYAITVSSDMQTEVKMIEDKSLTETKKKTRKTSKKKANAVAEIAATFDASPDAAEAPKPAKKSRKKRTSPDTITMPIFTDEDRLTGETTHVALTVVMDEEILPKAKRSRRSKAALSAK